MGTDLRDAARQALEALTYVTRHFTRAPSTLKDSDARAMGHEAITALRAALEQPTRAQKMRDAGYTRRPTLREMAALEQPEQEPVAWTLTKTLDKRETTTTGYLWFSDPQNSAWTPLFTHPPRREWRGLTEEEIMGMTRTECADMRWPSTALNIARAIEAALKERNA